MENKNASVLSKYRETFVMLIGEALVSVIVCAVFLIIKKFDYTVALGAVLGSAVSVINMFILSFSVNRAVDKYVALRGDREMTEEEEAKFVNENGAMVKIAAQKSYILRTLLMLGALVLAFITGQFNVIAAAVPLIAYRPILFVFELLLRKKGG